LQRPVKLFAETFHVDMQLILGAMLLGIHGEPNVFSAHIMTKNRGDSIACFPGCCKIIRRPRSEDLRAFDTGNTLGGDQEEVRAALRIGEHGVTLSLARTGGDGHTFAGLGIALLQPVGNAVFLNNLPQGVAILGATFGRKQCPGAEEY
jgi:hypothetical protein